MIFLSLYLDLKKNLGLHGEKCTALFNTILQAKQYQILTSVKYLVTELRKYLLKDSTVALHYSDCCLLSFQRICSYHVSFLLDV